jgi:selenocysteine lyase/cysteine desulfurase
MDRIDTLQDKSNPDSIIRFSITGKAAHSRIKPLLPSNWIDCSPYNADDTTAKEGIAGTVNSTDKYDCKERPLHFLWENAPRHDTKQIRDAALCYSHLPNGIEILDDKWVLSRLLRDNQCVLDAGQNIHGTLHPPNNVNPAAVLDTICFRGRDGLMSLYQRMRENAEATKHQVNSPRRHLDRFVDLDPRYNHSKQLGTVQNFVPRNLWVIKDANSNGYGGVWIMNMDLPMDHQVLLDEEKSPLGGNNDSCRYVAQEYAWPPVLYQGRKCHVRVYAVVMSGNNRAYVHRKCFLHVANKKFDMDSSSASMPCLPDDDDARIEYSNGFDPAVHITNCCANSHDPQAFAGEILADLQLSQRDVQEKGRDGGQKVIPLKEYYPSIEASVRLLMKNATQFVQGGERNNGFEYLGLDFILSRKNGKPVAYLLEVNCPPSQDTATGLKHAEDLHDEVLKDLIDMWVIPCVECGTAHLEADVGEREGRYGWYCVHKDSASQDSTNNATLILPSKAAILNKIRWSMFERRMKKKDEEMTEFILNRKLELKESGPSAADVSTFARTQFPYFSTDTQRKSTFVFLENAGGSQVPTQVVNRMVESLSNRHRSVIGQKSKEDAKRVTMTLLGGSEERHKVFFGQNASSLFESLARLYVRSGFLRQNDHVILASENHSANVVPWVDAVARTGAHLRWWTVKDSSLPTKSYTASTDILKLLCPNTRLVCLSHASNVLGSVRDIRTICYQVREKCPRAHVIIDGVAAAPHVFPAVDISGVDWYCVSFHKIFGPHIGAIVGRNCALDDICNSEGYEDGQTKILEMGTLNYEGCSGIVGLGQYFSALACFDSGIAMKKNDEILPGDNPVQCQVSSFASDISVNLVMKAYERIKEVEIKCLEYVKQSLSRNKMIQMIEDESHNLPIISFVHKNIPSKEIVEHCSRHHIIIRCGSFLMTEIFQSELYLEEHCSNEDQGIVRASFCHYNTYEEAKAFIATLHNINGW